MVSDFFPVKYVPEFILFFTALNVSICSSKHWPPEVASDRLEEEKSQPGLKRNLRLGVYFFLSLSFT